MATILQIMGLGLTLLIATGTAAGGEDGLGAVFGAKLYGRMPDGAPLRTGDGGSLIAVRREGYDRPERVSFELVGAVRFDRTNDGHRRNGILLTTACADADGRLWQVTERIDAYDLWDWAWASDVCVANAEQPPPPGPFVRKYGKGPLPLVTDRTLLDGVTGTIDGRVPRLVGILVDVPGVEEERRLRVIFPLHERLFGYDLALHEETITTHDGTTSRRLALLMNLRTDARPLAAMNGAYDHEAAPDVRLADLNPVRVQQFHLRSQWAASGAIAEPADREEWTNRLLAVGLTPEEIGRRLAPTAHLHYRPAGKKADPRKPASAPTKPSREGAGRLVIPSVPSVTVRAVRTGRTGDRSISVGDHPRCCARTLATFCDIVCSRSVRVPTLSTVEIRGAPIP